MCPIWDLTLSFTPIILFVNLDSSNPKGEIWNREALRAHTTTGKMFCGRTFIYLSHNCKFWQNCPRSHCLSGRITWDYHLRSPVKGITWRPCARRSSTWSRFSTWPVSGIPWYGPCWRDIAVVNGVSRGSPGLVGSLHYTLFERVRRDLLVFVHPTVNRSRKLVNEN